VYSICVFCGVLDLCLITSDVEAFSKNVSTTKFVSSLVVVERHSSVTLQVLVGFI